MAEFATLQHATYTEAEWTAWDGILLEGQMAFSSDVLYSGTDQMRYKVGNGTDTWTALDYVPEPTSATSVYLTCRNNSGGTINKGEVVYISGATSSLPTIAKAKADAEATSYTIGVAAVSIANNTNAANNVILFGQLSGIDTSAFTAGDKLYVSSVTAGAITNTNVSSPNFTSFVGHVLYSHASNGIILVQTSEIVLGQNTSLGSSKEIAPSQNAVKSYADAKVGSAMTQAINEAKGSDIASAATTDIGAATGNFVHITGTTTITALGTAQAGARRTVRFAGVLTLTHNATSLILPTGANITTAANDVATFVSEGSGNWRCVGYLKADGTALAVASSGVLYITNTSSSTTGDTNENILYSSGNLTGLFSINSVIRFLIQFAGTSSANTKTIKLYVGTSSNSLVGATQLATYTFTTNTALQKGLVRNMRILSALTSNEIIASVTAGLDNDETALSSNASITSIGFDFSGANVYFHITGQNLNSGETITLRHSRAQLIK